MIKFSNPFKRKKKQEVAPDEERNDEIQSSSRYEDFMNDMEDNGSKTDFDNDFSKEDDLANPFIGAEQQIDTKPAAEEAKRGKRLRGGLVAGVAGLIAMIAVGAMAYNFLKPKEVPQIRTGGKKEVATSNVGATPGSTLPGSYSDLAKYEAEQKQKEREQLIKSGRLNPAREQREKVEAQVKARKQAEETLRKEQETKKTVPRVTQPPAPSMPQGQQGHVAMSKNDPYAEYKTPVGFNVTESGKVSGSGGKTIFSALPGTGQATGKKYKLHTGTVIPATMLTGLTGDSQSAGVTAQIRQDVYDSLTGTHLLLPQGSKIIGTGGGGNGRRLNVNFNRIILPNGASITLSGPHATDNMGYRGLRDKYDEKWGPTLKGAFLSGIFTGIADAVGDIKTRYDDHGNAVRSTWGNVAEKISDKLSDKASALDKNESPAAIIRPGFQFQVYLTEDIEVYQYQPLKGEPR